MAWMKQQKDETGTGPQTTTARETPQRQTASTPAAPRDSRKTESLVNIGQSVEIKGELTGNEDLTIDGNFEGKIMLKDHHLTIGNNGHITAEIEAKSVQIHGEVNGNVRADDKVEISPSGSVNGDLAAPRVMLADGSSFKGSIDMSGKTNKSHGSSASSSSTSSTKTEMAGSSSGSKL